MSEAARHVEVQMGPIARLLADTSVFEVVINRAGEVFVESRAGWRAVAVPELTFERLDNLARAIATLSAQKIDERHPIFIGDAAGWRACAGCPAASRGCGVDFDDDPQAERSDVVVARTGCERVVRWHAVGGGGAW